MIGTVSVVIPTHNRRALLLRTLRSVLCQREVDFEVVVVDDGSTDGTAEVVRSLDDSRIRVLRNERPLKVASARNQGARAATGDWIALLDDDDLWSADKLVRQLGALKETGLSWVYAGVVEIDTRGLLLGGVPPPCVGNLLSGLTKQNLMPAGCSNVMIRSELYREAGGFDVHLRHLADWDLWLRLTRYGPPARVPLPLVAYRIHAGQASLDPVGMIAEGRILEARHGADLNSIRRWLALSHLRRGERRSAIRAYARAVLTGDVASLGRAAIALFHPHPTRFQPSPVSFRHRSSRSGGTKNLEWLQLAERWLRALDA